MPAKVIKYRFTDNVISLLMKYDMSSVCVRNNEKVIFYKSIDENNINGIMIEMEEKGLVKRRCE